MVWHLTWLRPAPLSLEVIDYVTVMFWRDVLFPWQSIQDNSTNVKFKSSVILATITTHPLWRRFVQLKSAVPSISVCIRKRNMDTPGPSENAVKPKKRTFNSTAWKLILKADDRFICNIDQKKGCRYEQARYEAGNFVRHFRLVHPDLARTHGFFTNLLRRNERFRSDQWPLTMSLSSMPASSLSLVIICHINVSNGQLYARSGTLALMPSE